MHKFTHPYSGSVLFIQRPREVAAFVAAQPRVLPTGPQPTPALGRRVLLLAARLVLIALVLLAGAVAFFLFGEDRDQQVVRPALTAQQRANAFRL